MSTKQDTFTTVISEVVRLIYESSLNSSGGIEQREIWGIYVLLMERLFRVEADT